MGKTTILTARQIALLDHISNEQFFTDTFYFTGGTALSEVYLSHRVSDDLDFFSDHEYDSQKITQLFTTWSKKLQYTVKIDFADPTHIYLLSFPDGSVLKVDFAQYAYPTLQKRSLFKRSLQVDSLFDIAVNKFVTMTQRAEVKDFVDIYFLLSKYTVWDLRDGAKSKFGIDIDPFTIASNYMTVEDFQFLPRMIQPLTLDTLKTFFRKKASELSSPLVTS